MTNADGAKERSLALPGKASDVLQAKRFAELAVSYCDARTREATLVVVAELAENLVKYGKSGGGSKGGTLGITLDGGIIRVRARNVVRDHADGQAAVQALARLSGANAAELYRQRLHELFQNPKLPRAQLGLLRIAFETGFKLSCNFEPPWLEIVAERPLRTSA